MLDNVTIKNGNKIRTWGGWYRHDAVLLDGKEIGFIQVKRRNKRTESITCTPGNDHRCVLGTDVQWLVRQALINKENVNE